MVCIRVEDGLKEALIHDGASLVGFADVTAVDPEKRRGYPRAVSLAIALDPLVVTGILSGPHVDYCHEYDNVNKKLDALGYNAEKWLKDRGFDAYAVTRARAPYSKESCVTDLPHKTAAHLAGLGWIGKNALLVTQEFGCAQRLTTVLTDAPLQTQTAPTDSLCGACRNCRNACPGGAIRGELWREGKTRDEMVDFTACQKTLDERGSDLSVRSATCGMCIAVCPFTKRYTTKFSAWLSNAAHRSPDEKLLRTPPRRG